ncbi:DNA repair protein rad10 [Colletotrichum higginsianum]|uniref:DNA repair protein rad10 n=2 Tax=Colletotrichum higginsianum TaxID=80884 RepID=H1VMJ4_COLHI|nr:DNA repair protein rad10 [Colletotrichum higginsianum IMI 349063]OBR02911.1 DNA repair protein rad10 [Colletotrichum higginsianum IMI 349063]TID07174.1 Mating-type switching protein swi10 [Colletotrichum higginsianum]CCF41448.1 DNA repair protein rad10 [Colletotrichum higginsianum]
MEDDFGADEAFLAALASSTQAPSYPPVQPPRPRVQQPTPQKVQQPTPQRLDRAPPANSSSSGKVVQPTPQPLPQRGSGSAILVSPRQRGNPVLASLKSMPWEYSDIAADYGLGLTTCALFLSLKYHRLHPEYIYTRIRNLQGKYNLRIMLTMVDIPNHEEVLRELSKTSLVNNVTIILCWSAAEAARYLELYKSYEHANFNAIRGQQASTYAEKLVEFVTVPRSVNKSDAVALVSNFGSLKNAINADPEQIGIIAGWGAVKVNKWAKAVEEPFRAKTSAKRHLERTESTEDGRPAQVSRLDQAVPLSRVPLREMGSMGGTQRASPATVKPGSKQVQRPVQRPAQLERGNPDLDEDDEEAMIAAAIEESMRASDGQTNARTQEQAGNVDNGGPEGESLPGGVAAALAKLRKQG